MRIVQSKNYQDLSYRAANIIQAHIVLKPNSVLGLATGATAIGVYEQLISFYQKGDIDFSDVVSFNLDEYIGLGADNPQSYRYFMDKRFFNHINIQSKNTYVPNGLEANAEKECTTYEANIERVGGIDLQLLGLGQNGHIGFNEPGESFEKRTHHTKLTNSTIEANSYLFPDTEKMPHYAYTTGIGTIMKAKSILVIASGKKKAKMVREMVMGPITPQIPASILQLHDDVTLVADIDALSMLLTGD